ncbi:unnamed protein product [Ilex paraguariensis]|uniref:Uncharacterized protein n=1 Tax=Ilex paraguariensis TaxID=185542 RepID=A0ABC8RTV9_9AQUA
MRAHSVDLALTCGKGEASAIIEHIISTALEFYSWPNVWSSCAAVRCNELGHTMTLRCNESRLDHRLRPASLLGLALLANP